MSIRSLGFFALALAAAAPSFAAPPANVAGIWTLVVDQQLETLDIAQGGVGLGPCPPITGKIGIATVRGFYCPATGRLYFHHSNFHTDVTVRTFDGVVAAMDLLEAARRVMDSAEPAAPLRMLAMARQTLAAVVRRQAASARIRVAA